jgi:hypothetical protein
VVQSSLGIPTDCVGKLQWQTVVMFGEAAMVELWDSVGEATTAKPIRHKRELLGGCDSYIGCETPVIY